MRFVFLLACLIPCTLVCAQDTEESSASSVAEEVAATGAADTLKTAQVPTEELDKKIDRAKLFADFESMLKKSSMIGTFTIDGDNNNRRIDERYDITKVVKQPNGDYWNFHSRIRYGKWDVTLPIPVEVKWAGTTPVITVDNLTIPGLGSAFDSRIVIADGKYAGTWRHGKVGGLMFGQIKKQADLKEESEENEESSDE